MCTFFNINVSFLLVVIHILESLNISTIAKLKGKLVVFSPADAVNNLPSEGAREWKEGEERGVQVQNL